MDHKLTFRARKSRDNDARVIRTRASLHRALLSLAERVSFADITVTAIAGEAGIGYATFFRHYPDKHSLLTAIAGEFIDELMGEIRVPTAADTRNAAMILARFVDERRAICHALLVGAGDEMRRKITDRVVQGATAMPDTAPHRFPRALLITQMVSSMLAILAWWLDNPGALNRDELAEALDRLALIPALG
ncbi:TetR/AcrR family transcriptional regulator [Caenibius tardaugens NBRC 16725]|nr:TetR/AcrR family transcriptional regulator [Caenibius tardaugens NBRC 16725]